MATMKINWHQGTIGMPQGGSALYLENI